ncbi:Uncharacterised protein [Shewanella morhuae]|uniref:YqhI domain-containing protein n=1 Tax=Shewanella morhuae TaxID=365591 RepID=A0A380AGR5_9GAMM|nr:Uncharacterised protein [Shewanella morhuae]
MAPQDKQTQVTINPRIERNTSAIPQEAFDWYDEYAHGIIDRREFMGRLAGLVALGFTMTTLTGHYCQIMPSPSKCLLMTPLFKQVM